MKNFEYYGLFLTEESKTKLLDWLARNCPFEALNKDWFFTVMYLDHCTLLHKSQDDYIKRAILEDRIDEPYTIIIDGIGANDKAMAFRVKKDSLVMPCTNNIPHIAIYTFKDGKPVDSNSITEWKDIEPIIVETKLEKR